MRTSATLLPTSTFGSKFKEAELSPRKTKQNKKETKQTLDVCFGIRGDLLTEELDGWAESCTARGGGERESTLKNQLGSDFVFCFLHLVQVEWVHLSLNLPFGFHPPPKKGN